VTRIDAEAIGRLLEKSSAEREKQMARGAQRVGAIAGHQLEWEAGDAELLRQALGELDGLGGEKEVGLRDMLRALINDIENVELWLIG